MNQHTICIYEDEGYVDFGPLTQTRAVWDLRCGALTMAEKIEARMRSVKIRYHIRNDLKPLYLENGYSAADLNPILDKGNWLFLSGRIIFNDDACGRFLSVDEDTVFTFDGAVVAFRLSGGNLRLVDLSLGNPIQYSGFDGLRRVEVKAQVMNYPWQIVNAAHDQIAADLELVVVDNSGSIPDASRFVRVSVLDRVEVTGRVNVRPGVIVDAENYTVRLEDGVRLGPGVVIDAAEGPVWIAAGANIQAGAILTGPVYIGSGSVVRSGARLSDGVCLGPQCRIGGEVSRTVFQGYSNKQHSGYLGTSFVGSWVNLGAATDNSDLKNNYRPVDVTINGKKINTGALHVGAFIGDFSRTAIHTRLNSGAVIGVCCNIFGEDFPIKEVPAFTWFGSDGYREYHLEKSLETIRILMPRRGKELMPTLETLLREIFRGTRDTRKQIGAV